MAYSNDSDETRQDSSQTSDPLWQMLFPPFFFFLKELLVFNREFDIGNIQEQKKYWDYILYKTTV